jgi:hypothetical protein
MRTDRAPLLAAVRSYFRFRNLLHCATATSPLDGSNSAVACSSDVQPARARCAAPGLPSLERGGTDTWCSHVRGCLASGCHQRRVRGTAQHSRHHVTGFRAGQNGTFDWRARHGIRGAIYPNPTAQETTAGRRAPLVAPPPAASVISVEGAANETYSLDGEGLPRRDAAPPVPVPRM